MKRMLWLSSLPEDEREGIKFRDFELFCRLLNNLDDFTVAVKYISQVGRPLSRKEFKRAAKVCLNGKDLSSHLVDTIFIIFGAGEGKFPICQYVVSKFPLGVILLYKLLQDG